jgi:hypothetical protein
MVRQYAFTFLAPLPTDRVDSLRNLLKKVNKEVEDNEWFPFLKMETIHFARLLILEKIPSEQKKPHFYPYYLVFSTNYDGPLDVHLNDVVNTAGKGFREIFGYCENGPSENSTTEECISFLKQHSVYRAYFYIGTWGLSVSQIRHQEKVRQLAEEYLDMRASRVDPPEKIRQKMVTHFQNQGLLESFEPVTLPKFARSKILLSGLVALFLLPIWLPLLIVAAVILLIHERLERPFDFQRVNAQKTYEVANQEDHIVQNQLTHLVEIKFSFFRRLLLKMVLSAIQFLAIFLFNKGKLGNIPTIHFARWVRIDNGKRLLFFSNYDGSWESYLGDFIDKAAVGLTGVWSNSRWFPKTLLLLLFGARDEQRFKAWTRFHQVYTDVWYSAYKTLSVRNILNNAKIYQGLQQPIMSRDEAQKWLSYF